MTKESRERLKQFFFNSEPAIGSIPFLDTQKILVLYISIGIAVLALFVNLPQDIILSNWSSVCAQILFALFLLIAAPLFWITRKVSYINIPVSIALICIITEIIYSAGGEAGFGMLYLLPAYPAIYLLLGMRTGNFLLILMTTGLVIRFQFGAFLPYSIFQNPFYIERMTKVLLLSTLTGIGINLAIDRLVRYLCWLATYDTQSGLPSRWSIQNFIERKALIANLEQGFAFVGVQVLNLNRISAMFSADEVDYIMEEAGARLTSCTDCYSLTGRWNSSLFTVVFETADFLEIDTRARRILDTMSQPFPVRDHEVFLLITISITRWPFDGNTAREMINNLLSLQSRSLFLPGEIVFFNRDMMVKEKYLYSLSEALLHADFDKHLQLHYQPKIRFSDQHCVGAEVLLRWHDPVLGPVSPAVFIPIAEETGLIRKITRWLITRVVSDLVTPEYRSVVSERSLVHAINLSVHDLRDQDLTPFILRELAVLPDPATMIEFEITEGVLVDDNPWIRLNLEHIHSFGYHLAIDDFGTGYSSLSYLHRLEVHNLKIDQSFVKVIDKAAGDIDYPVVNAIIALGASLGLEITAEGVETWHQFEWLKNHGCNTAQGWLFSKGLPFKEYLEYLRTHQ